MDRREVQRLVDARERAQRQVAITSRAVAVGSVALAAVFGIVLAQHPQSAHAAGATTQPKPTPVTHAIPTPPPSSGPSTVSPPPAAPTTVAPTTVAPATAQPTPVLQPPPAPPVVATGGGSATGSGGS